MRLAYSDDGPGRVVVLLHGFPLSRAMWEEQISGIGSIYRTIAPDLRGHGESPAPEGVYTMDEMADDVVELLDSLSISERIVLGGQSMGGYVALSLVVRHPDRVRGLMLFDTRAGADTPEAAQNREISARTVLATDSVKELVDGMIPKLFSPITLERRPERIEPLRTVMEGNTPRGVAGALRGMAIRPDRRADLSDIKVPTLILVGEHDAITPPAEAKSLAEAIPNSQLEVVPESGHMAPYENPSAANRIILRFLQGLEPRN